MAMEEWSSDDEWLNAINTDDQIIHREGPASITHEG